VPENHNEQPSIAPGIPLSLDGITRLLAALGGIAYATGVVAINTYLHELGIADFSFAKPKLLLTGILVLFTLLVLASPIFFLAWWIVSFRGPADRELPSLRWIVFLNAVSLILLVWASATLCFRRDPGLGQITVRETWEHISTDHALAEWLATLDVAWKVYAPLFFGSFFVGAATWLFDQTKALKKSSESSLEIFYFSVSVAAVSIAVIAYVYIFIRTFYPAIPQEYGGGAPYFQSFAITDGERCHFQEIGIPFDDQMPGVTQPLPVLHETDAMIAVWLRDQPAEGTRPAAKDPRNWKFKVVQIDKAQITAMRAYPQPKPAGFPKLSTGVPACAAPQSPTPDSGSNPIPGQNASPNAAEPGTKH